VSTQRRARPEAKSSARIPVIVVRLTVAVALLAAIVMLADSSISWAQAEPPKASASGDRPIAGASQRKRLFVGVVGFAAFALGVAGLWMLRRSRTAATPETRPVQTEPPAPVVTRIQTLVPASASPRETLSMVCPTCRSEYGAESRFCKLDGNRLVPVREGADSRGPTGGVCPVCSQGFDPGIQTCPIHDEELVPAGSQTFEDRPSGPYPKICPTCGVQYPNGSGFCGADGSALVTVN